MPVSTLRRAVVALALVLLIPAMAAIPATAQTAASVMEDVRNTAEAMFEDVDNYIMKTDMYTAYYKKEDGGGPLDFRSAMQMQGQSRPMGGEAMPDQYEQYGKIGEHGTYVGTETINGINCHVIRVDDPSKVDAQMAMADEITYYIGTSDSFIHGMDMTMEDGNSMAMRMKNYQNYDGIMYPSSMEMTMVNQSAEMKQQMAEMEEQLKQMSESMRKRMQKQMEQARAMIAGEPTVIEVQEVVVNGPLPEGVFEN